MYAPRYPARPDDRDLPRPPLPMLITGVTGVTGYNALRYFQAKYPGQVFALRQPDNQPFAAPDVIHCDALDCKGLTRAFDQHRFKSVLDCAGNCALKPCEVDPKIAWEINVEGIHRLLEQTVAHGARLVHLSVDLVFGGKDGGGYFEDDATDPVTVYGRTMVEGEQAVASEDPAAATLRISLPMGESFNGHAGAVDWIESRFKQGRPATLYYDEVRTPTYTDCMNRVLQDVLAGEISGVFHFGGPRRLSLYEIAQVINRVGGYDPDLLHGMPRHHAGPIPPRAGDVTMDSTKLADALGYQPFDPWPLDESLVPTDRRWHHDRPSDVEHAPRRIVEQLVLNPSLA